MRATLTTPAMAAPDGQELTLSIIVPVYNEASTIEPLVKRVLNVGLDGIRKEVLIIDDGSRDESPSHIASLHALHDDTVQVFTFPINVGKGAAIRLGIEMATGDIILIQDADLELNPEEYPQLLAPILSGETQVVYGSRFLRWNPGIPLKTRLANWLLTAFTNLLFGGRLTDMATAYKVFRSEIVKELKLRSSRFEFEPEVTAQVLLAGHRILEVPISYNPRTSSEGKKIAWIDALDYFYTLLKYRFHKWH